MTVRKIIISLLTVIITIFSLNAQTSDLLRVEYLNIPNNNSENSIERLRAFFQLPLKINEKDYIVVSGDYRNTQLDFNSNVPFNTKDFERIQRIEAIIGFIYRTSGEWIYAANGGLRLASNFVGSLVSDDYIYVANVYVIRNRSESESQKPSRLILGLNYTTTPGRDFPLPIINYYKEFHPNWTYILGVPKTNVRYKINKTNHIQSFLTLDNFHANIQKNLMVGDDELAEHISMTTVLGGLGYEYYFTDHLLYYDYFAYTISNDHRLRDNDREDIYTFEDQPSFYLRTGIKFKI